MGRLRRARMSSITSSKDNSSWIYWPTMKGNADKVMRECGTRQKHSLRIHIPAAGMIAISSRCLYAWWGFDIVGPLSKLKGVSSSWWSLWITSLNGWKRNPRQDHFRGDDRFHMEVDLLSIRFALDTCL